MRDGSPGMFGKIVLSYDRMNRIMSLGMDMAWRRNAARFCSGRVLDLCSGTGDMARALGERGLAVVGLDGDMNMLRVARDKSPWLTLVLGDAQELPFRDSCFDSITVAWGLRNLPDKSRAAREAFRVLRPGGKYVVLDAMAPENPVLRAFYRFYTHFVVPLVALWLTPEPGSYRYLARSIDKFGTRAGVLAELRVAGFESARATDLSFGAAVIFVAEKPHG